MNESDWTLLACIERTMHQTTFNWSKSRQTAEVTRSFQFTVLLIAPCRYLRWFHLVFRINRSRWFHTMANDFYLFIKKNTDDVNLLKPQSPQVRGVLEESWALQNAFRSLLRCCTRGVFVCGWVVTGQNWQS